MVVQISAKEYYGCQYELKSGAALAVGRINEYYKNKGKNVLLLTPGLHYYMDPIENHAVCVMEN